MATCDEEAPWEAPWAVSIGATEEAAEGEQASEPRDEPELAEACKVLEEKHSNDSNGAEEEDADQQQGKAALRQLVDAALLTDSVQETTVSTPPMQLLQALSQSTSWFHKVGRLDTIPEIRVPASWPDPLECFEDRQACCKAFWCPCLIFADTTVKTGFGTFLMQACKVAACLALVIVGFLLVVIGAADDGSVTAPGLVLMAVGWVSFVILLQVARAGIAEVYSLRDPTCPFLFYTACGCHFIPLVQESKLLLVGPPKFLVDYDNRRITQALERARTGGLTHFAADAAAHPLAEPPARRSNARE